MLTLDRIAEQRIATAIERGELEDLPGAGLPLELDDDSMVPEELRAAHRIMKNAGLVPERLRVGAEIASLTMQSHERGGELTPAEARRLSLLCACLGDRLSGAFANEGYRRKALERLGCSALQSEPESPEPPSGLRGE